MAKPLTNIELAQVRNGDIKFSFGGHPLLNGKTLSPYYFKELPVEIQKRIKKNPPKISLNHIERHTKLPRAYQGSDEDRYNDYLDDIGDNN